MKVARLREETGIARTASILQNDVYGWFLRESRGIYALSPKGSAALETYASALKRLDSAASTP